MNITSSLFRLQGLAILCRMSSSGHTHMERTEKSSRNEVVSQVTVAEIEQLSPRVKGYKLHVASKDLTFRAGQWVDLYVPGVETVGGYSITSSPWELDECGSINLAIQHSDHPPAHWMTTKCQVGDELTIQVGGDFIYAPPSPRSLLLIAGGVGINPLFSMYQHHASLLQNQRYSDSKSSPDGRGGVQLLFSAKSVPELIFKDSIDRMCSNHRGVSAKYFITKENDHQSTPDHRIGLKDITKALSHLDHSTLQCYVCGPPPMTEDILRMLLTECHIESSHVHYEKWW